MQRYMHQVKNNNRQPYKYAVKAKTFESVFT